MTKLDLRLGSVAKYERLGDLYSLGCAAEVNTEFKFKTLVCSFGLATDWEPTQ